MGEGEELFLKYRIYIKKRKEKNFYALKLSVECIYIYIYIMKHNDNRSADTKRH